MGRARGPLSPPVITQSIVKRPFLSIHGVRSSEPNNGSHDRNRTAAGNLKSRGNLFAAQCWFSTVVPSQMFAGHSSFQGTMWPMFWGRFVSSNQSSQGVALINSQRRSRWASSSGRFSNTSAMLAQKTRSLWPLSLASSFQISGSRQCGSPKKRRSAFAPQTFWPIRFAQSSA